MSPVRRRGDPYHLIRIMPAEGRASAYPSIDEAPVQVTVIGAGVAGLVAATELSGRGAVVTVLERGTTIGAESCSWLAGGMLAPWCERESAEPIVAERGALALGWWPRHFGGTVQRGTLVVAPARDQADLQRFSRRTSHHVTLDREGVDALEPDLGGRFRQGLFFAEEAHLDPREALAALAEGLTRRGVKLCLGTAVQDIGAVEGDRVLDTRGFAARPALPALRGVRGEMIVVRAPDVGLTRPIRFLHPRIPLYIVPRSEGRYMIGATMVESDARGPMTVRSAIELLSAAFALHPGFAEAEILEFGANVRPSFPDNLPRVETRGRVTALNGLYRHGFLLSPAYAGDAVGAVLGTREKAA